MHLESGISLHAAVRKCKKIHDNTDPFSFGWVKFSQAAAANLVIQAWRDGQ